MTIGVTRKLADQLTISSVPITSHIHPRDSQIPTIIFSQKQITSPTRMAKKTEIQRERNKGKNVLKTIHCTHAPPQWTKLWKPFRAKSVAWHSSHSSPKKTWYCDPSRCAFSISIKRCFSLCSAIQPSLSERHLKNSQTLDPSAHTTRKAQMIKPPSTHSLTPSNQSWSPDFSSCLEDFIGDGGLVAKPSRTGCSL